MRTQAALRPALLTAAGCWLTLLNLAHERPKLNIRSLPRSRMMRQSEWYITFTIVLCLCAADLNVPTKVLHYSDKRCANRAKKRLVISCWATNVRRIYKARRVPTVADKSRLLTLHFITPPYSRHLYAICRARFTNMYVVSNRVL